MGRRRCGRDIDGVLLLDKDRGVSSNNALQQVRRAFNARKAGHTGSLDPLATGLLPICFGEATKVAGYLLNASKSYRVTAEIGAATDTGDADGQIMACGATDLPSAETIKNVLAHFEGDQQQIPPMYSALKYKGRPLYEYARAGQTIPREPRAIYIDCLTCIATGDKTLTFDADVSAGTYIRRLVEDIAAAMDRTAHVIELRRLRVGALGADKYPMIPMETLFDAVEGNDYPHPKLIDLSALLADWPVANLDDAAARAFVQGQVVKDFALPDSVSQDAIYRVHRSDGRMIAIATCSSNGVLHPKRVFTRPL